jgi:hypothetical protein
MPIKLPCLMGFFVPAFYSCFSNAYFCLTLTTV